MNKPLYDKIATEITIAIVRDRRWKDSPTEDQVRALVENEPGDDGSIVADAAARIIALLNTTTEPRGCPTPGACSCVANEAAIRADERRKVAEWHDRQSANAMNALHVGAENHEYRAAHRLADWHIDAASEIRAMIAADA